MKRVHKLVWIGLFVNIVIRSTARDLLLNKGQLNFHHRAGSMWSWPVPALLITMVVQAVSIMSSGCYPCLAIALAFIGSTVMVPANMVFLIDYMFSFQTRINAGLIPWRSMAGAISRDSSHQLLTFSASGLYLQGALVLIAGIIIPMTGMGIGGVFITAGIVALCNGYRLQSRMVIGMNDESMIFTPELYADTYVIPLGNVMSTGRGDNDTKVRLRIRSNGKGFALRKKLLAGDNVNDAFAAILAKLSTVQGRRGKEIARRETPDGESMS